MRDRLLIRLLFHMGCRITEVLSLKPEDVDFGRGMICILHLKRGTKRYCGRCGGRLSSKAAFCPSCGERVGQASSREEEHRRQRVLPVDNETLGMLKDYIRRGGPVTCGSQRLIFGINRHRSWQIVRDCAERAGLPKLINPETGRRHNVSPHRLRDSFAVHAVKLDDSGDSLRMLQEHLGHRSITTTMRYRKVSGKEHREWYRRLWEESANG